MSLFTPPNVRPTDEDNIVLAGAKWRFCLAGTTTPASIYTTSALNVAHTNPVEAVGTHFPPIYLDPTVSYRATLQTSAGATVTGYDFDPIEQMSSNSLVYTPAGTGAVATTVQTKLRRVQVDIEDFGGGTGVSDNTAACKKALDALDAAGGGVLQFGAGTYQFASAVLSGTGIPLPANITIQGKGKGVTTILVTGSSACYLFVNLLCKSNQLICDLTARGNSVATDNSGGSFYWVYQVSGLATADVRNCIISNVRLENFGADQWVWFYAGNASHKMWNCGVDWGCEAQTYTGNARNPGDIGVISFVVVFRADGGGIANDCFVNGFSADLDYVKGGIAAFGAINRLSIRSPNLRNAFQAHSITNMNGYAIVLYDAGGIVTDTIIDSAIITNPFTCGIYTAGSNRLQIITANISGQEDGDESQLPKGAIALNGATNWKIIGALLGGAESGRANFNDISISGPGPDVAGFTYPSDMNGEIIGGSGLNATNASLKLAPGTKAVSGGVSVKGFRAIGAVNAFSMQPSFTPDPDRAISRVWFTDCEFNATGNAVNLNAANYVGQKSDDIAFHNCVFSGANAAGSALAGLNFAAGKRVSVTNCRFTGTPAQHLNLDGITKVTVENNHFIGVPVSANMHLDGCQGTLRGNIAENGSTMVFAGTASLGRAKPTWSGVYGLIVQNVLAAAGEYPEWFCTVTTTWKGLGALEA